MEHTHTSHSMPSVDTVNQECMSFAMRKVARAITQIYDRALEPTGIRSTQFTLLVTMASGASATLTEMANVLVMDRTTLTRNLKPLEKMGLIEGSEAKDKRSKAYVLTQKGRDIVKDALPRWKGAQDRVLSVVGSDKARTLLTDLDIATRALSEI